MLLALSLDFFEVDFLELLIRVHDLRKLGEGPQLIVPELVAQKFFIQLYLEISINLNKPP